MRNPDDLCFRPVTQSTFRPAVSEEGRLVRLLSKVRVVAMNASMLRALLSEQERMLADGGRAQKMQLAMEVFRSGTCNCWRKGRGNRRVRWRMWHLGC